MSSPEITFTSGPRFARIHAGVLRAQENGDAVPLGGDTPRGFRVAVYGLAALYDVQTTGWEPCNEADFDDVVRALVEVMGSLGGQADLVPPQIVALLRRKQDEAVEMPSAKDWREVLKSEKGTELLPLPATEAESEEVLKRHGFVFDLSVRARRCMRYEGLRHGQALAAIYSAMHSRRFRKGKVNFEVGNALLGDYVAMEIRVAHCLGVRITLEYPDGRIVEVDPDLRGLPVGGPSLSQLVGTSIAVRTPAR